MLQVVSCSQFEAHAGRGARRAPYDFIFTGRGDCFILGPAGLTLVANGLTVAGAHLLAACSAWHCDSWGSIGAEAVRWSFN